MTTAPRVNDGKAKRLRTSLRAKGHPVPQHCRSSRRRLVGSLNWSTSCISGRSGEAGLAAVRSMSP
jgi:hypothetical protein